MALSIDLIIANDDGSQQQKLSWLCPETGELKRLVVPNSLRKNWKSAALRDDIKVFNYTIDGRKFTYDVTSEMAMNVSHVDWQYSDECTISVHHALLQTGLDPEKYPNVKIIATLPITQYYSPDDLQRHEGNIQRKKDNLMRKVVLNGGKTFNIAEVKVMPESAPACMSVLLDENLNINEYHRTLVIDLGGVTLDMAIVRGKFEDLTSVTGNSNLGVSMVTGVVKHALAEADSEVSWHVANQFIVNRNDREFVEQVINDHSKIDYVLERTEKRIAELSSAVVEDAKRFCSAPNRILVVGGGGPLVLGALREAYPSLGDRVQLVKGAESVLAVELMKMHANEARVTVAA
ncbi:plasmid segregation protein ParM domain-containing protein [Vibrio owensii]|uniref:plasmid segregation protein ParM domain-containing protein n=1 Tax=Vibrio owensii TaxID=696485 RepID=UPI0031405CB1